MDRRLLFDDSPAYTKGDPSSHGFHELERPQMMRWIATEADCRLPAPAGHPARPALLIRAIPGRFNWTPYLSVSVNGAYVETQAVSGYGSYYFELDPALLDQTLGGDATVTLTVNNSEIEKGGSRRLGLALYELRLLDLDEASERFDERALFIEQISVFEDPNGVALALRKAGLGPESRILDVGAGMGWSSALLSLFTGAQVIAVDLQPYDAPLGVPFKAELRRRLSRHFSVLKRSRSFSSVSEFAEVERAIDRCTFLTMNAEELLLRDDLFDFAFSLNAFEHIPHPDHALAEIRRTLRTGGQARILFSPAYYSDRGHHLHSGNLLDQPWVHLLHDRQQIKEMIAAEGKVTNEVDNILETLNRWRPSQFEAMYQHSGLQILGHHVRTGFSVPGAEKSEAFRRVRKIYPLEDLTTIGMDTHLIKAGR